MGELREGETVIGQTCSHGIPWADNCRECNLVSARELVAHWGHQVDEARALIATADKADIQQWLQDLKDRGDYIAVSVETDEPYFRKGSIVLRGDFFPCDLERILCFAPKEEVKT